MKRTLYARLGVCEYWLFDPRGEYLDPALQGHRLHAGEYHRIAGGRALPGGGERAPSAVLGLELHRLRETLRYFDPVRGRYLPTPTEESAARHEAETARQAAETARREAEGRLVEEAAARQEAEGRLAEEATARREAPSTD